MNNTKDVSDPFVEVFLVNTSRSWYRKILQTEVISDNLDPIWNTHYIEEICDFADEILFQNLIMLVISLISCSRYLETVLIGKAPILISIDGTPPVLPNVTNIIIIFSLEFFEQGVFQRLKYVLSKTG